MTNLVFWQVVMGRVKPWFDLALIAVTVFCYDLTSKSSATSKTAIL